MSAPPLPDTFGNYALGDFAEVVPPDAVSWLPQTVGWAWLGTALLALALYRGGKKLRVWYGNRYRREGIVRLQQLENYPTALVAELNRTLKLVALVAYSRSAVARLSGREWVDFLNRQCEAPVFDEHQLELLASGGYRATEIDKATASGLINASLNWINEHRSTADV